MNRHGHHNIRNGIVWVQTGHNTCTCTATVCDWTLTTPKIRIVQKIKFSRRQNSNSNLLLIPKKTRNRSSRFGSAWYELAAIWAEEGDMPRTINLCRNCYDESKVANAVWKDVIRHKTSWGKLWARFGPDGFINIMWERFTIQKRGGTRKTRSGRTLRNWSCRTARTSWGGSCQSRQGRTTLSHVFPHCHRYPLGPVRVREAVKLVVCGVWRPVRPEESEQNLGHVGQHGPPWSKRFQSARSVTWSMRQLDQRNQALGESADERRQLDGGNAGWGHPGTKPIKDDGQPGGREDWRLGKDKGNRSRWWSPSSAVREGADELTLRGCCSKLQDVLSKATTPRWLQNVGIMEDCATDQSSCLWSLMARPFVISTISARSETNERLMNSRQHQERS